MITPSVPVALPVPVLLLVGVEGEVGVVALLMLGVLLLLRVATAVHRGEVSAAIAVIVGVRGAPDLPLALLAPSGTLVLMAEAMQGAPTAVGPTLMLLLLGMATHSGSTTIREAAAVVPSCTNEGLVVGATHLRAHGGRGGLVGGARGGVWGDPPLLHGADTTFTASNRGSVTSGSLPYVLLFQGLLLSERGAQAAALSSSREHL